TGIVAKLISKYNEKEEDRIKKTIETY
ncbi:MAG: hypothetical protein RLZZ414_1772, partial [Bacteroidota bacterium]